MTEATKIGGGSLALRLCTIALIPMAALGVTSYQQIEEDSVAAEASAEFADAVSLQRNASSVIAPANLERTALEGLGAIDALGVDRKVVTSFVGIDFEEVFDSNRVRLDDAIDTLYDSAEGVVLDDGTSLRATLDGIRDEIETQRALAEPTVDDPEAVVELYDRIDATLQHILSGHQTSNEVAIVGLGDAAKLQSIARAEASAGSLLQSYVYGLLYSRADQRDQVLRAQASHETQLDTFQDLLDPDEVGDFEAVRATLPTPSDELLQISSDDGTIITNPALIADVAAFILEQLEYLDVLDAYAADVQLGISDAATARADAANQAVTRSKILVAAVAGVLLLITIFVLISLGRPLLRLSRRAAEIGHGDLSVDPLPLRGPKVVRRLTASVNEMLVTLSGVDRQIARMSTGDLSPATNVELPGAIGVTMRQSVQRLSSVTEQLAHQARHDLLTGLPNRFAAMEALDTLLQRQQQFALLFIDVDGFKGVNDTHGHETGDEVLREVARRLLSATREGEFIARLGGDEFVVVMSRFAHVDEAVQLGHRLIQEVEQPYGARDIIFALSASIGVAVPPSSVSSVEALHQADSALYLAKHRGRGRVELFDAELQERIEHEADLALALRHGVRNDELELHFQPVMSLATGQMDHAEALVRWNRPNIGMVSPGEFIPIAERSSLIFEIERWVLHHSCVALAEWSRVHPDAPVQLAVNISGRHLIEGDLLGDLDRVLQVTGADPSRLQFELTETHLLEDLELATTILNTLRSRGISIAVDDFGTGYSSMNYLRDLPIDTIKIDRSFVARSTEQGYDSTVIEAVLTIARSLGLVVVAEGIETHEQLHYVRSVGCHLAQGFLMARPTPRDEAERVIFGAPSTMITSPLPGASQAPEHADSV